MASTASQEETKAVIVTPEEWALEWAVLWGSVEEGPGQERAAGAVTAAGATMAAG